MGTLDKLSKLCNDFGCQQANFGMTPHYRLLIPDEQKLP